MLSDLQATGDKLGATGFSFSDNDDGTSSVSFGFPDQAEDGSLSVTVTRDFSVPTSLADKVRDAMNRNATATGAGVMGDSRRAPSTGTPAKSAPAVEARQGSQFGGQQGAPATSTARGSLGNGLGTRSSKSGGGPDGTAGGASVGTPGGSPTGTASSSDGFSSGSSLGSLSARAASVATAAAEASREPSVAATSLPGGTMTDAPTVSDTVTRDASVPTGKVGQASGSWENRFGTGRSYYGSDSIRSAADSIKGKSTKDARATAMREARQENPAAFVAATVLAELDPPQLKSLLTDAESQLEARKILDVIANRALLGGTFTRGNGPLGGVMGEAGTISPESLSDAVAAKMQFSPVNLTGDKAAREANQRVMGYMSGEAAQAEMAMVLGMIDQMTSGATAPQSDDTHYLASYMAETKSWSRQMGKGTKVGGHTFKSEAGASEALAAARAALEGQAESSEPTGSEIADRIAKAMESAGSTRYDKEGNAYYKDKDGDLVDEDGNIVEEKTTGPKSLTDYAKAMDDEAATEAEASAAFQAEGNKDLSKPYGNLDGWGETNEAVRDKFIALQEAWGAPLPVNSSARSKAKNKAVGGAKKSQHLQGNAIDISVKSMTKTDRKSLIALASAMGFEGIGVYTNAIHVDLGNRRSWGINAKGQYSGKAVPSWARSTIAQHISGKFKGRADEFARTTETEFSLENANLPERNPFTAESARIAQGLQDAPDSSIAPANEAAQGFANSIRDAIAKAESDPIGTALGGLTSGGTGEASTADAGVGPTGAVPAPDRNPFSTPGPVADSSYGRQQVDAADKAKEASDAAVAAISQKVAEIRAEIEAGVTGMPATNFDTGRRQVSGTALGEAQAAAAAAAKTAELAPRDDLGAVASGFAAGEAIAGAEATESRFSLADTLANNPSLLGFKDAPPSLDSIASKTGYSVASVDAEQAAEDARGLLGQLSGPTSITGKATTAAKATKAAVASAEANAKVALAKAEKAIGQLGLSSLATKALKESARQSVASALAEAKAQIAEADMEARIESDVAEAEREARRDAIASAYSDSKLESAAGFSKAPTGTPLSLDPSGSAVATTAPAGAPTLSGLPDDAKVEAADTTTVDIAKGFQDIAKQIVDAPAKGLKIAKEAIVKETAKQVAKIETKMKESGFPQAIIGQAVAQARAQIAAQLSRGIDDEVIRQRRAEEKAKKEAAEKKTADKKKSKKKQKPVDELEKLLATMAA